MAFDSLQDKLTKTIKNIQGKGKLTEANMEETLKDIRVALLESDVNYGVTKKFLNDVREKALGEDVINAIEPSQLLIKIIHDEIISLLKDDESANELKINENGLTTIMMVGLQGTGKTTQAGKLANLLKTKKNKKVLLVACDVIRKAAIEQLQTLGNSIGVEVFSEGLETSALQTAIDGVEYAKENLFDVVIIDTAGRLQIDEELMNELVNIKNAVHPDEILLTVDALTGQDISNVASTFNEKLNVTGLIATKFDGDSKGGSILSVKAITGVPIKFVGVGEKIEDIDGFYPDRLADRILGMGDVVSLVEKAQEEFDEKEAEKMASKMLSGKFTMDDLLWSLEKTRKMGPLGSLMKMIPGMSDMSKAINDDEADKALIKTKAIIQSMTIRERQDPSLLRNSHKRRIAAGSGTRVEDVNKLINQYDKMKKVMKQMSGFSGLLGR